VYESVRAESGEGRDGGNNDVLCPSCASIGFGVGVGVGEHDIVKFLLWTRCGRRVLNENFTSLCNQHSLGSKSENHVDNYALWFQYGKFSKPLIIVIM
jgi:hypothetical protein